MVTRKIRKIHRFLGLFIGVQIFFWSVSGLFFTWNNIENVRGENLVVKQEGIFLQDPDFISPSHLIARFIQEKPRIETIDQVTLRALMGKAIYEIRYRHEGLIHYALADPRSGEMRSRISEDEAVAIAEADFAPGAQVLKVDFITEVTGGSEYRGRPLPAYRVEFDHPSQTRIYISGERGFITARRNSTWRIFDFLWMLHIMDYENRDDFNTLLLQGVSVLGLITVVSGFLLWGVTSPYFKKISS